MKLYIRSVTGEAFDMASVEESITIGDIKQQLSTSFALPTLNLCHRGRVLDDDSRTLANCNVEDGGLLVIAGRKLPTATGGGDALPPMQRETSGAAAVLAGASDERSNLLSGLAGAEFNISDSGMAAEVNVADVQSNASSAGGDAGGGGGGGGVRPEVEMIMAMGFDDIAAIERALTRANNNVEQAINFMFEG